MFKRIMPFILALALLAMPIALAEQDQIEQLESKISQLEQRISDLEEENGELRALLSEEESGRLLAARFKGGIVTIAEAKAEYEYRAYDYTVLGMDPADYADIIKEELLNDLTEDAVLKLKAQELGVYELTEEQTAEITQRAQESLNEMVEYYLPFFSDGEKTDEENREAVLQFLKEEDTTLESLVGLLTAQTWRDRLFESATADLELSEEELRDYYDEVCQNSQLSYSADPASYETDRMNGEAILWNPEGYRTIKRVLIGFDDAGAARMAELEGLMETTTDETEVEALLEEMEGLYATLEPTVQEVLTRIEAQDDFNLLIDEYGCDPYMASGHGREEGYYVSESSTLLDEVFVLEAMALENPGDVSGPIECGDGIYILRYEGDVSPGAVSYEEFLTDEDMLARVEESARNEYYFQLVETWLEEAEIETYPENF